MYHVYVKIYDEDKIYYNTPNNNSTKKIHRRRIKLCTQTFIF